MALSGKALLEKIEEGTWKGLPQWRCRLCPFDSMKSKDAVVEHILQVHVAPPKVTKPGATPLLVDRHGNALIAAAPGVKVDIHEDAGEKKTGKKGHEK